MGLTKSAFWEWFAYIAGRYHNCMRGLQGWLSLNLSTRMRQYCDRGARLCFAQFKNACREKMLGLSPVSGVADREG